MKVKDKELCKIIICFATALFIIVGWAIVDIRTTEPTEPVEEETVEVKQQPLYGTVEYVETVPAMEWVPGDIDFQPIDCNLDTEVQEFIYYLSYGYNIDFYFIMAVIEHESSYRADVISKTNDYGLMQINICNHEWLSEALGITDFLDPEQNVMAGTYIFHTLFEEYGNDTAKVLMAYNMGEPGASNLWNQGIYESKYSREIMQRMAEMKEGV